MAARRPSADHTRPKHPIVPSCATGACPTASSHGLSATWCRSCTLRSRLGAMNGAPGGVGARGRRPRERVDQDHAAARVHPRVGPRCSRRANRYHPPASGSPGSRRLPVVHPVERSPDEVRPRTGTGATSSDPGPPPPAAPARSGWPPAGRRSGMGAWWCSSPSTSSTAQACAVMMSSPPWRATTWTQSARRVPRTVRHLELHGLEATGAEELHRDAGGPHDGPSGRPTARSAMAAR